MDNNDLPTYESVCLSFDKKIIKSTNKFTKAMWEQCLSKYGEDLLTSERGRLLMVNEWNRLGAINTRMDDKDFAPMYIYYI